MSKMKARPVRISGRAVVAVQIPYMLKDERGLLCPDAVCNALNSIGNAFNLMADGHLGEGRSLDGAQGVYSVKVLRPLQVTDDGIGINPQDPWWAVTPLANLYNSLPAVVVGNPDTAGTAGTKAQVSRGDHAHQHGVLGAMDNTLIETLGTALTQDDVNKKITLGRKDLTIGWDDAGHGNATSQAAADSEVDISGWLTGSNIAHNLLNGVEHPDTVNQAPVIGSLILGTDQGGAVIKWDDLPIGTVSGQVLTVSGGTAVWATPGDEKVKVSSGDSTAEYLEDKLVDTTSEAGYIDVDIDKVDTAGVETLRVLIDEDDIQDAAGTDDILIEAKWLNFTAAAGVGTMALSTTDWRGRAVTVNAYYYTGTPANARNNAWTRFAIGGIWLFCWGDSYSPGGDLNMGSGGLCTIYLDKDDGHIKVTDTVGGDCQVYLFARGTKARTAADETQS